MILIGLTGNGAGCGKDTAARMLCQHEGFCSVALADPFKRLLADVMEFDRWTLWGDSAKRNEPDAKGRTSSDIGFCSIHGYSHGNLCEGSVGRQIPVTARDMLQKIGEAGRQGYENIWSDYAIKMARQLTTKHPKHDSRWDYTPHEGLKVTRGKGPYKGVVITDVRHDNEARVVREAGGVVVKLIRDGAGLKGEAGRHVSEKGVSPDLIDYKIDNNHGFSHLERAILAVARKMKSP